MIRPNLENDDMEALNDIISPDKYDISSKPATPQQMQDRVLLLYTTVINRIKKSFGLSYSLPEVVVSLQAAVACYYIAMESGVPPSFAFESASKFGKSFYPLVNVLHRKLKKVKYPVEKAKMIYTLIASVVSNIFRDIPNVNFVEIGHMVSTALANAGIEQFNPELTKVFIDETADKVKGGSIGDLLATASKSIAGLFSSSTPTQADPTQLPNKLGTSKEMSGLTSRIKLTQMLQNVNPNIRADDPMVNWFVEKGYTASQIEDIIKGHPEKVEYWNQIPENFTGMEIDLQGVEPKIKDDELPPDDYKLSTYQAGLLALASK